MVKKEEIKPEAIGDLLKGTFTVLLGLFSVQVPASISCLLAVISSFFSFC